MKKLIPILFLFGCSKQKINYINPIYRHWKSITQNPAISCDILISNDYFMFNTSYYTSFNCNISNDSIYEIFNDGSKLVQFGYKINYDTLILFPIYPSYSLATKFIKD